MIRDIINANGDVMPNDSKMAVLKKYFPSCFKSDGYFDIERFAEYLKDKVDISHEGYEWLMFMYPRLQLAKDLLKDDIHFN